MLLTMLSAGPDRAYLCDAAEDWRSPSRAAQAWDGPDYYVSVYISGVAQRLVHRTYPMVIAAVQAGHFGP